MSGFREFTFAAFLVLALCGIARSEKASEKTSDRPPNVIFILADDLGYAELGCYGQKRIRTPNIDRMAAEGMRFTNYYAASAVCAPSRCMLLTGKHAGHAAVRNNREVKPEGQFPLPADETTIGKVLKANGYVTAAIGKWGLGPVGSSGDPLRQGFDFFYGYNCQRHAHNHYPKFLYRNDKQEPLEGNDGSATGKQYSHDLFEREALAFIDAQKNKPFFLYLAPAIPHLAIQVPEDSLEEYAGKWDDPPYAGGKGYLPHDKPRAAYAAMVTRLDRTVGRILERLKQHGIDERTLVVFTSDNGATFDTGGADSAFFKSVGELRGLKGSLYEGGIRVPLIVRQPGKIAAGTTSDFPAIGYDWMATLSEVTKADAPKETNGVSLAGVFAGKEPLPRDILYWEFPGYTGQQAVRWKNWKGIRRNLVKGKIEMQLYDLAADPGESRNVADANPEIVAKIEQIMRDQHRPSKDFPLQTVDRAGGGDRN
jgi:arylsulfatase A